MGWGGEMSHSGAGLFGSHTALLPSLVILRNGSDPLGDTTTFHVLPEAGSVFSVNENARTTLKVPIFPMWS